MSGQPSPERYSKRIVAAYAIDMLPNDFFTNASFFLTGWSAALGVLAGVWSGS